MCTSAYAPHQRYTAWLQAANSVPDVTHASQCSHAAAPESSAGAQTASRLGQPRHASSSSCCTVRRYSALTRPSSGACTAAERRCRQVSLTAAPRTCLKQHVPPSSADVLHRLSLFSPHEAPVRRLRQLAGRTAQMQAGPTHSCATQLLDGRQEALDLKTKSVVRSGAPSLTRSPPGACGCWPAAQRRCRGVSLLDTLDRRLPRSRRPVTLVQVLMCVTVRRSSALTRAPSGADGESWMNKSQCNACISYGIDCCASCRAQPQQPRRRRQQGTKAACSRSTPQAQERSRACTEHR